MDPLLQSLIANIALALFLLFGVVTLLTLVGSILSNKTKTLPWFVLIGFAVCCAIWLTLRT